MQAFIKDGVVIGIYPDDVEVPKGCTAVALDGRTDMPHYGYLYDGETFTPPKPAVRESTIESLREAAITIIDTEVSAIRQNLIGGISNQFGVYTAKYQEAKAWQLKLYGTDISEYPWVGSEVSARGCTADEAAETFRSKYVELITILTKLEEMRVYTKMEIREATELSAIRKLKSEALASFKQTATQP